MGKLRRWLFLETMDVTREEALSIAHAGCDRRGLPWLEPVRVFRHYGDWSVWTHADHKGGNVRVIVDAGRGDVLSVYGPVSR
jgi:hypothetical protein